MHTTDLALIIPAAGRGSRFDKAGSRLPKPLIDLHGRPFFWWSAQSLLRSAAVREIVVVVLEEHVREHAIDQRIHAYFPQAKVVAIPHVTDGAAQTAAIGVAALSTPGPVAINDCDHAFMAPPLAPVVQQLHSGLAGALMSFASSNPAYSYLRLDAHGGVCGTVEKQVVSHHAIAGCYLFADSAGFDALLDDYAKACAYPELFVSGMYNLLAERHAPLAKVDLLHHVPFGTPEEQQRVTPEVFAHFLAWR